jgi:hypothetical protein
MLISRTEFPRSPLLGSSVHSGGLPFGYHRYSSLRNIRCATANSTPTAVT